MNLKKGGFFIKIEELIEKTAQQTARAVVSDLTKKGLIKDNRLGSFKKTERILYEYPRWQKYNVETENFCNLVEKALESVSDDPYYKIIELKYFQKWTHERIAEYFGVDVSIISKRRTKLINQLRPIIFSTEFIQELYEE